MKYFVVRTQYLLPNAGGNGQQAAALRSRLAQVIPDEEPVSDHDLRTDAWSVSWMVSGVREAKALVASLVDLLTTPCTPQTDPLLMVLSWSVDVSPSPSVTKD